MMGYNSTNGIVKVAENWSGQGERQLRGRKVLGLPSNSSLTNVKKWLDEFLELNIKL